MVFGVEKLVLSKLYEYGANKRIIHIDNHIGMVRCCNINFRKTNCLTAFLLLIRCILYLENKQ